MRITNKIIQSNSLTNINNNKTLQDNLSTQISSGKKISRPSDDPIVALRSLRLRTSISQTEQYADKNVEDAKSWLKVTEDAINTLSNIITSVRQQFTKGTSDTLTPSDRKIILNELQALSQEIYNTGNADFAGRYVFAGYRTSTTLTYQKSEEQKFLITEDESTVRIDSTRYVHNGSVEQDVYVADITRIRLSYNNIDNLAPTLTINGTSVTPTVLSAAGAQDPYEYAHNNAGAVFIPETGEILLGTDFGAPDSITDISVEYQKSEWSKGDLRPEHYFKCTDNTDDVNPVVYNEDGVDIDEIEYNIGVNQSIRINTLANECFNHNITRDIQDAISALTEANDIDNTIARLEAELKLIPANDTANLKKKQDEIDAAQKAKTYISDKLHTMFSTGITKADGYLDANNVALTTCGTRSKRLELIENRLDTQLSTLTELKSENEDIDLAETAIKLASAEYAYDAALMATSKILKENLLNYI